MLLIKVFYFFCEVFTLGSTFYGCIFRNVCMQLIETTDLSSFFCIWKMESMSDSDSSQWLDQESDTSAEDTDSSCGSHFDDVESEYIKNSKAIHRFFAFSEDTDSSSQSYSDGDDNLDLKRAEDQCPSAKKLRLDSSKDHAFINYVSDPPSLKSIALVAIAVKVYGYPEKCKNDYDFDSDDDDSKIEIGAREKLKEIFLPELLKQQVSSILRPIDIQWLGWVEYAAGENFALYCNLNKLYKEGGSSYWTMEGVVDVVRLVKGIANRAKELSNKKVNFSALYESSCMYCIEDSISDLWLKLPDKKRSTDYYTRTSHYHQHIIAYWTASLNNELPNLMRKLIQKDRNNIYNINLSVCVNLISSFIVAGNVIALKYFWKYKLTEQEKNSNIQDWIRLVMKIFKKEFSDLDDEDNFTYQDYNSLTSMICFLLSHLNSQVEQREIFERHAKVILLFLFFHWPLQRFFLTTITVMLDFLQENIYVWIMSKIAYLIRERRTEVLLREVWDITPINLKKAFLRFLASRAEAIAQLLIIGDEVTIDKILNSATAKEKKRIFFCLINESEFSEFMCSNKLAVSVIDRLASKALGSDCDLHSFKQNLILEHGTDVSTSLILSGNFLALDEFWNWVSPSLKETDNLKRDFIDPIDVYRSLIAFDNYEHVNKFLNWYFEAEEDILKFKKSFVYNDNFKACKSLLKSLSYKGKRGWKIFERFQDYSFDSSDEISEFKKVFAEFVKQEEAFTGFNDEFNTLFKNWCLNSSDKVTNMREISLS